MLEEELDSGVATTCLLISHKDQHGIHDWTRENPLAQIFHGWSTTLLEIRCHNGVHF